MYMAVIIVMMSSRTIFVGALLSMQLTQKIFCTQFCQVEKSGWEAREKKEGTKFFSERFLIFHLASSTAQKSTATKNNIQVMS